MVLHAIGATQVRLVMTFDRINDLMLLFAPWLPVFGLPVYLLFVLVGKGTTRIAVFLSLSAPGLLILVYDILMSVIPEPGRQTSPGWSVVIFLLLFNPGALVLLVVFIFQIVNIFRGKWLAMTKSRVVIVGLLLLPYFWNFIVMAMVNDVRLHPG
jgi:hypothetical protein